MKRILLNLRNEIHIDDVKPGAVAQYSYRDNENRLRILIRDVVEGCYFWRDPDLVTLGCSSGVSHGSLNAAIRYAINYGFQVYQSDTLFKALTVER